MGMMSAPPHQQTQYMMSFQNQQQQQQAMMNAHLPHQNQVQPAMNIPLNPIPQATASPHISQATILPHSTSAMSEGSVNNYSIITPDDSGFKSSSDGKDQCKEENVEQLSPPKPSPQVTGKAIGRGKVLVGKEGFNNSIGTFPMDIGDTNPISDDIDMSSIKTNLLSSSISTHERQKFRLSELTNSITSKFSMSDILLEDELNSFEEDYEIGNTSSIVNTLRSFGSSFTTFFSRGHSVRSSKLSHISAITGDTGYISDEDMMSSS